MQCVSRGLRIQVYPDIIVIILFIVPQYKVKLVLNRSIFYYESELRPKGIFPFKPGNSYIFFVKINSCAGSEEQSTKRQLPQTIFDKLHSPKICVSISRQTWPWTFGLHSTFRICSFAFSSSSFMITTHFWIVASYALAPVVFISLPISWSMKESFLPFDPSGSSIVVLK